MNEVRLATRVLVVDDDLELCELLERFLVYEGFDVEAAHDGNHGVERALSGDHALIVLDVTSPGVNGFDGLRQIREKSTTPVLVVTARADEVDRIVGLELGADDYLSKPFNPRELAARIRAILRRAKAYQDTSATPIHKSLRIGDLELDHSARVVRRRGAVVALTPVEFNLLEMLMRSVGRIVSRKEIVRTVLRRDLSPYDRCIDTHLSNLRRKLGRQSSDPERIKTVRGVGYIYLYP